MAAFQTLSIAYTAEMETAIDEHDLAIQKMENNSDEQICYNDATAELVGALTQSIRIEKAFLELNRQLVEFENLKNDTQLQINRLQSDHATEVARPRAALMANLWLDANIDRAHDKLWTAKRAAWLGLRALEYETQGDYGSYRDDILAARTPLDLESVLENMRDVLETRTLHGGSAGQLLAVVSFRDDVMQLVDQSDQSDDWHTLNSEQRLQSILTDAQYQTGEGDIRIPFTVAPLAPDSPDSTIVIPLQTETDCAERLWSVNAALVGEDLNRDVDDETTFARVLIEQRNTFSSQWCVPEDHAEDMQTSSTRPLRNLFADPWDPEADPYQSTDGNQDFTRARLSAYYGVGQAELEQEEYFNGDSLELAGRGLYGDYALIIPAGVWAAADDETGLALEEIDDLLLRFDYVSVAQ